MKQKIEINAFIRDRMVHHPEYRRHGETLVNEYEKPHVKKTFFYKTDAGELCDFINKDYEYVIENGNNRYTAVRAYDEPYQETDTILLT